MITLTVIGIPASQGSKNAYVNKHTGRAVIVDGTSKTARTKLAEWRRAVADAAREWLTANPQQPLAEPLHVTISFRFPATASDPYRYWHCVTPDASKVLRSTEDALVDGGLLQDDRWICKLVVTKRFVWADESPGCTIEVVSLAGEEFELRQSRKERAAAARRAPSLQTEALPL